MNHFLSDGAAEELDEAAAYYEAQRQGLAAEYISEFEKALQRVIDFPEAWGLISKEARLCLFDRFPYGIVYVVRDDVIRIIAVMHLHRRPGYWKGRLKKMSP